MELTTAPAAPASLEEVQALFEHWRQNRKRKRKRKRKTPIPETLWEAAASLYPCYSLHRISRTLSINHTKLKHYAKPETTAQTPAAAEDFIELEPAVCRQKLREDPFAGHVFVFRNKKGNAIRLLMYDGQRFWLCQKRLSKGRFSWWPDKTGGTLTSV